MKKEKIDELYKEDLKMAKELAKAFARKQGKRKLSLVGIAKYYVDNISPEKLGKQHAKLKKAFREILWNQSNNSDIHCIEYFEPERGDSDE